MISVFVASEHDQAEVDNVCCQRHAIYWKVESDKLQSEAGHLFSKLHDIAYSVHTARLCNDVIYTRTVYATLASLESDSFKSCHQPRVGM